MRNKLSDDLLLIINDALSSDPQKSIPVIITVKHDFDIEILKTLGLNIHHYFSDISVISGTLAADKVNELLSIEQIILIEYDSAASAL